MCIRDSPEDDNKRVLLLDLIKRLVANGADLPDEETVVEAREVCLLYTSRCV